MAHYALELKVCTNKGVTRGHKEVWEGPYKPPFDLARNMKTRMKESYQTKQQIKRKLGLQKGARRARPPRQLPLQPAPTSASARRDRQRKNKVEGAVPLRRRRACGCRL